MPVETQTSPLRSKSKGQGEVIMDFQSNFNVLCPTVQSEPGNLEQELRDQALETEPALGHCASM